MTEGYIARPWLNNDDSHDDEDDGDDDMSLPASISLKGPGADKYLLPIFLIVLQNMTSYKSQVTCPVFFLLCDFIYMYEYVFYLRTMKQR